MNFDDWSDAITKNLKQAQEQYWKNISELSTASNHGQTSGIPNATAGMEQWWSMMSPQMPKQSDDAMKHATDMNKAFSQFAENFARLIDNGANDSSTNPLESWLANMEKGFKDWSKTGQQDNLSSITKAAEKYSESMKAYTRAFSVHGLDSVQALRERMAQMQKDGGSIKSMRELYDLWVDVSEEVYSKFAMSKEFQNVYGDLVNSFVALKSEMDSVLGSQLKPFDVATQQKPAAPAKKPTAKKASKPAAASKPAKPKPAAKPTAATKPAKAKPAAKPAAATKSVKAKPASKPAAVTKPVPAKNLSKPTATTKSTPPKKPSKPAAITKPDDLKKVKGIGPKLQEKLAAEGITTFKQLAAVSPKQANELDTKLELLGRLLRDDWINQATRLAGKS